MRGNMVNHIANIPKKIPKKGNAKECSNYCTNALISQTSKGMLKILKKGMATRSSILAWRIPWTEEPGGPQPMWSQRVRRD